MLVVDRVIRATHWQTELLWRGQSLEKVAALEALRRIRLPFAGHSLPIDCVGYKFQDKR